jgi:hypothetical protein
VHRLATDFVAVHRAMIDQRRALEYLSAADLLPPEHRFCIGQCDWPDLPGDRPWRAAIGALEADPGAPLPL